MKFYESISQSYDKIFPLKESMVKYVLNNIADCDKYKLLDIGCATGHLDGAIAEKGIEVVGIDLNSQMIEYAIDNYRYKNLKFYVMDMLKINKIFETDSYDMVTCFGNTLVHLTNEKEIYQALKSIRDVMKDEGKLLIQILNYRYILDNSIKELPIIENQFIKFERFYSEQIRDERLIFETRLTIKKTGEVISNEIYLYPLLKEQLIGYLQDLGFGDIKVYKNFDKESYSYNHLPLIVEGVLKENSI
ncbi:SAM-dependent methyltransferase [Vallitalea longa]|uniref:SAM-dependent methyltransferase n=1 Tax=Vallitalea longa TaxID=2936439 RepID=A0A9W6DG99_9FIRM|nr:class I SAM-dependent methyltransferase [Vallitalea longa]GKX29524.1 SAM-dependent methyltransferase [Vallitalea longa]